MDIFVTVFPDFVHFDGNTDFNVETLNNSHTQHEILLLQKFKQP